MYVVKMLYELRDENGHLKARGTLEFCEKRKRELVRATIAAGNVVGDWTILPYEIERFENTN
jgi:hypothetical protein